MKWWMMVLLLGLVAFLAAPASAEEGAGDFDGSNLGGPPSAHSVLQRLAALEDARIPPEEWGASFAADGNPVIRARTARALGRLQDPATVGVVVRLLGDGDGTVRAEAAFALGQIAGTEGVLLQALAESQEVPIRLRLVEGLGKQGKEGSLATLDALLDDSGPAMRATAARALGRYGVRRVRTEKDLPAVPEPILAHLRRVLAGDPEPPVRAAAAYALFRLEDAGSAAALAEALNDADPDVRLDAARGLAATAGPDQAEALGRAPMDADWRVRVEMAKAVGRALAPAGAEAPRALVALLARLTSDDNPHVRRTALGAAAKSPGQAELLEAARARLQDDEAAVAAAAAEAVLRLAADVRDLNRFATASSWRQRQAAARGAAAFARSGKAEAATLLRRLARDEERRVAEAALETMAGWDDPSFRPPALENLKSGDAALAPLAAAAFAAWKDPAGVPAIVEVYGTLEVDVDSETMQGLLEALGEFGDDPRARQVLEHAAKSPDANLRRTARQALKLPDEGGRPGAAPSNLEKVGVDSGERVATVRTVRGNFRIRLLTDEANLTVRNFWRLAHRGFYEGITFHRVVPDFVVQAGCPRGDGWGGPGYSIRCEINPVPFERGTVGMALAGKDTGGSQWFVCHSPQPHLDGNYTVFGQVVEGMDVVDSLQEGDAILGIDVE